MCRSQPEIERWKSPKPKKEAKEAKERKNRRSQLFDSAIIEELLKDYQKPEDLTGPEGMTRRLYERVLGAEMTHYLGYEKGQAPKLEADQPRQNHRNWSSKKTLLSEDGKLEIEVPPGCIRWCFSTHCESRFVTKERSKTRPFTWL